MSIQAAKVRYVLYVGRSTILRDTRHAPRLQVQSSRDLLLDVGGIDHP